MSKSRNWIARICALGLLLSVGSFSMASVQDAKIVIDHALNSPTLTVRYSGAHVSLVELRLNGASYGTRSTDPSLFKGETNFTIDMSSLTSGDNSVEVRLYDKSGTLVGIESSSVSAEQEGKAPVFLQVPKVGTTVQGPVQIAVGFGKDLHNTYVSFFIDNQFKSMTNSPPFEYIWDTTRDTNGWHEIEAWAVDDASTTYKTKKVKVYVNNPGGNTYRQFTQPEALVPEKVAIPKAVPTPVVHPQLKTSIVTPSVAVQGASRTKSAVLAAAKAAHAVSHAITPTVVRHTTPKRVALTVPIVNTVNPQIGITAGPKGLALARSVASGPRMLMPTGKRVASDDTHPVLSGPIGPGGSHLTKAIVLPKVNSVPGHELNRLPMLPNVSAAVVVAKAQPKVDTGISISVVKPEPKIAVATKPAVKTSKTVKLATSTKTVKTKAPVKIAVVRGTKLPNVGNYSIQLNSKTVKFDAVKPRVENNVPLTPFRYLFEQSGGTVDWYNQSKSVNAHGADREIYIKIGDKLAKVNNLPIELDLTPFIDHGRTIVPLSFIKDALDVDVDYDPVTNHVLITSIKKKH